MFSQFIIVLVCTLALINQIQSSLIGLGAQKLKNLSWEKRTSKSHDLQSNTDCSNVEEYYFKGAVIDNFVSIENQKNWEGLGQRFFLNKELWGGKDFPIFVFIGGEGQESCGRLTNRMYMYELAQQHHALLIDVEHRYYGESYPTSDMSNDNLKNYLSADQAMADLARIIGYIKQQVNSPNSQVITVGGSYPGNLAAWFRLKYPSVTLGSIASSAPLTAQTNFPEYMDVVGQSIEYFSGHSCYDQFEKAANAVAALASEGPGSSGWRKLDADFKTCSPMNTWLDMGVFLSDIMGNVQGTIQYNNEHLNVANVTNICNTMAVADDDISAYDKFIILSANYRLSAGQECEDASWSDTIKYLSASAKDPTNAARPWVFQTCNEFGYFQTTDSKNQPFHAWSVLNTNFSFAMCNDSFGGWSHAPQTAWINQEYGDVHIAGTNILFPSGTIDPWHALGVTNSTDELPQKSELKIYIEGTAHCNDLYAPANSDPATLTYARSIISEKLANLLAKNSKK